MHPWIAMRKRLSPKRICVSKTFGLTLGDDWWLIKISELCCLVYLIQVNYLFLLWCVVGRYISHGSGGSNPLSRVRFFSNKVRSSSFKLLLFSQSNGEIKYAFFFLNKDSTIIKGSTIEGSDLKCIGPLLAKRHPAASTLVTFFIYIFSHFFSPLFFFQQLCVEPFFSQPLILCIGCSTAYVRGCLTSSVSNGAMLNKTRNRSRGPEPLVRCAGFSFRGRISAKFEEEIDATHSRKLIILRAIKTRVLRVHQRQDTKENWYA